MNKLHLYGKDYKFERGTDADFVVGDMQAMIREMYDAMKLVVTSKDPRPPEEEKRVKSMLKLTMKRARAYK